MTIEVALLKCGACGGMFPYDEVYVDDNEQVRVPVYDVDGNVLSEQTANIDLVTCESCERTGSFELVDDSQVVWRRANDVLDEHGAVVRMCVELGLDAPALRRLLAAVKPSSDN